MNPPALTNSSSDDRFACPGRRLAQRALGGKAAAVAAGIALTVAGGLLPGVGHQQAHAQIMPTPEGLQPEGAQPRIPEASLGDPAGVTLPLDLAFVDENGQSVRLGDYFNQGKPVVIMPGYYECPMLCSQTMNGMFESFIEVWQLDLKLGDDYTVLSFSIDPTETPELAKAKQSNYASQFVDADALTGGWHFLTTPDERTIQYLTKTLQFGWRYVEPRDQYAHPAAIYVVQEDGTVNLLMPGTAYRGGTMRTALIDAGNGRIGDKLDYLLVQCFQFDAAQGKYTLVWLRLLSFTAAGFLVLVGCLIALMIATGKARTRRLQERYENNLNTDQPIDQQFKDHQAPQPTG